MESVESPSKKQVHSESPEATLNISSDNVGSNPTEDKSTGSNESANTPISKEQYADIKAKFKQHKTPPAARKQQQLKKDLPPPGTGILIYIYL